MSRRKQSRSGILFTALTVLMLLLCGLLLLLAGREGEQYRYLASLTPSPSPVPRKVSYIYDRQTPAPTALLVSSGAMGQTVYDIQARLRELGYYHELPDAKFGPGTLEAVRRFQAENSLTQDGIVGEDTYRLLMSSEARPCPTVGP